MKLDELKQMIAEDTTTAMLAEAVGQRMVRVPEGWEWEEEGAVCECGLLLARLPRTVRLERVLVFNGRPMTVFYDMSHAHLAVGADGRAACPECVEAEAPCPEHAAEMCDTPNPELCTNCVDEAALPGGDYCRDCRPYEVEWDKDLYLGL